MNLLTPHLFIMWLQLTFVFLVFTFYCDIIRIIYRNWIVTEYVITKNNLQVVSFGKWDKPSLTNATNSNPGGIKSFILVLL